MRASNVVNRMPLGRFDFIGLHYLNLLTLLYFPLLFKIGRIVNLVVGQVLAQAK
jgi:hypothetical protein